LHGLICIKQVILESWVWRQ